MSGLYIHIPFCKQKCSYCNFHFSTTRKLQQDMVDAMCQEIILREHFLPGQQLASIYFGGGTPSILSRAQMKQIFKTVNQQYEVAPHAEVTLEANPDDLTTDFLYFLKNETPVNRLSVGVQSFKDTDLKLMNRAHNADQALKAIEEARKMGFRDFNMDLIFGIPGQTMADWEMNLRQFLKLDLPHISCYSLTIEEKTAFYHWIQTGQMEAPSEEAQADFFLKADELLTAHGYDHYEISNYAQPGHQARHNTSYWQGKPYLGIGPSAHSFDGTDRYYNPANNAHYLKALQQSELCLEKEELSDKDRYNEYIMTGLRTKRGVDNQQIQERFAPFQDHFQAEIQKWLQQGHLIQQNGKYTLSIEGKLFSDSIMADLFYL